MGSSIRTCARNVPRTRKGGASRMVPTCSGSCGAKAGGVELSDSRPIHSPRPERKAPCSVYDLSLSSPPPLPPSQPSQTLPDPAVCPAPPRARARDSVDYAPQLIEYMQRGSSTALRDPRPRSGLVWRKGEVGRWNCLSGAVCETKSPPGTTKKKKGYDSEHHDQSLWMIIGVFTSSIELRCFRRRFCPGTVRILDLEQSPQEHRKIVPIWPTLLA